MSDLFRSVTLAWEGKEYTIPPERVFGAIAVVEEHVTLMELHKQASAGGAFKLSRISAAFADLLAYAGGPKLSAEQVYVGVFTTGQQAETMAAITTLLQLMIPKKVSPLGEGSRRVPATAPRSSRRRSGSRSASKA